MVSSKRMLFKKLYNIILFLFFITVFTLTFRTFWILLYTYTPDFSVYYQAAKNIISSSSVYTGQTSFTLFAYPLVSGIFFIPFTCFPYQIAQALFLIINIISLAAISLVIPFLIYKKKFFLLSAFIFSFAYLSFPTKFTLGMGQINLVAYLFLILCLYFYQVKKTRLITIFVGFLFAIACILKPIIGFMIIFFILQRSWKIILYTFLFFIGVFILSLVIDQHAILDYLYYLNHIIPEISKPVGKEIYYNQGFMSFIFRNISFKQLQIPLSYLGMSVIFLTGIIFSVKSKNVFYKFSLLLIMIPLLDTMSWQHHFIFLIFPFFYASLIFLKNKNWKNFIFLFISYFLVSLNFVNPTYFSSFPKIILLSNNFYGAFILFLIYIKNQKMFQTNVLKK